MNWHKEDKTTWEAEQNGWKFAVSNEEGAYLPMIEQLDADFEWEGSLKSAQTVLNKWAKYFGRLSYENWLEMKKMKKAGSSMKEAAKKFKLSSAKDEELIETMWNFEPAKPS